MQGRQRGSPSPQPGRDYQWGSFHKATAAGPLSSSSPAVQLRQPHTLPLRHPDPMAQGAPPDMMWEPHQPLRQTWPSQGGRSASVPPKIRPGGGALHNGGGRSQDQSAGSAGVPGGPGRHAEESWSGQVAGEGGRYNRRGGTSYDGGRGSPIPTRSPLNPLPMGANGRVRGLPEEVLVGCSPSVIGYGQPVFVPVKGSRLPPTVAGSLPPIAGMSGNIRQVKRAYSSF